MPPFALLLSAKTTFLGTVGVSGLLSLPRLAPPGQMPVSHGSGSYSPYMELGKTMTSAQQVVWELPNHRCLQCSVFWHFWQIDQLATAGCVGPCVLKGEGRQTGCNCWVCEGGCELPYGGQDSITAHLFKCCVLLSSLNPLMVSPQQLFRVLGRTDLPLMTKCQLQ